RELLVALDLPGVERERLFVGQRENVAPAHPVLEVEKLRDLVPAGRLPELDRSQHRGEPLLRPDRLHLLANHLFDFAVDTPTERGERPQPRRDLPDESRTHEELVT